MAPDTIPNAPTSGARTGGHDAGYHSVRVHGSLNVIPAVDAGMMDRTWDLSVLTWGQQ